MLSNTLRLNFYYLEIIHILHPRYPKIIANILKNQQKDKYVCLHEIIQLIIMKMKMKMKTRTHRYYINRPGTKDGLKFSKYKKCHTMMILRHIKQDLSNIWSSIREKVKQHWSWVEKGVVWKKACKCLNLNMANLLNFKLQKRIVVLYNDLYWVSVKLHKSSPSIGFIKKCLSSNIIPKFATFFFFL